MGASAPAPRPGSAPAAASVPGAERRRDLWAGLLLAAFCALFHARAATFGFTGTDDVMQVVEEAPFLGDLSNAPSVFGRGLFIQSGARGYYRPVVTLSFMLDSQWAGPRPFAFHFTNVLLHVLTTLVLFRVARRLGFARDVALVMGAIPVVHPSTTEAASWIPARGDDLLGLWFAGAFLALLRFRDTRAPAALAAHLALVLTAFFTKENAVLLPIAFAAYGLWVDDDRTWIRDRRLWIGWAAAFVAWVIPWRLVMAEYVRREPGLDSALRNLPTLILCLSQALDPFHPAALATAADTSFVPGLLGLVAFAAAAWWTRGRARRLLLWGLGTFLLLLAPSLPVSHFLILEHRLYAPWIGLFVAGLAAAQTLAEWRGGAGRRLLHGGAAALIVMLALLSFSYGSAFRDDDTFTEQAARSSPRSSLARLSRGIVLQRRGRTAEAAAEYEAALRVNPKQLRAHLNLGTIRHEQGDLPEAERLFRAELAMNPEDDLATYDLAVVLMRRGRTAETEKWLLETVRINPGNKEALKALGEYFEMKGDATRAAAYREELRRRSAGPS
jgi:Flp pilus assembly protein TadD